MYCPTCSGTGADECARCNATGEVPPAILPAGKQFKPDIKYGCGDPRCTTCYEDATIARVLSEAWL